MSSSKNTPFRSGFVAIIGRPNSGKSTLLNSVLGSQLSAVSPKAQTTRDRMLGILHSDRGQMVFVDTPGVHQAKPGGLNEYMVKEAEHAMEGVNLIWWMVDPFSHLQHEKVVLSRIQKSKCTFMLVFNKTDMKGASSAIEVLKSELYPELLLSKKFQGTSLISARAQLGVEELLQRTWGYLEENGPEYFSDSEQLSDRPMRYFVAEKIREQLFYCLGEEIPYSCAVKLKTMKELDKHTEVHAQIVVERDTQKAMVIGKGGAKIKEIGIRSRELLEKLLERKVMLKLQVAVIKNWTKDPRQMKLLGYQVEGNKKR